MSPRAPLNPTAKAVGHPNFFEAEWRAPARPAVELLDDGAGRVAAAVITKIFEGSVIPFSTSVTA
jgi:hypothetical protein